MKTIINGRWQVGLLSMVGMLALGASQGQATNYTNDPVLNNFTTPASGVMEFGQWTQKGTDFISDYAVPYIPLLSDLNAGLRIIGDGNTKPIIVKFTKPTRRIRVFPNIDHATESWDGYQYTVFGSNTGSSNPADWTPLFDAKSVSSVTGSYTPNFRLDPAPGGFSGTAPIRVNNVLSDAPAPVGVGPGGTVGYVADFRFCKAYQYYMFGTSTAAVAGGNADQELSAVALIDYGDDEIRTDRDYCKCNVDDMKDDHKDGDDKDHHRKDKNKKHGGKRKS